MLQGSSFEVLMPFMSEQLDFKSCARREKAFSGFNSAILSRASYVITAYI